MYGGPRWVLKTEDNASTTDPLVSGSWTHISYATRLTEEENTTSWSEPEDLGCETSVPSPDTFFSRNLDEGGVGPVRQHSRQDTSPVMEKERGWREHTIPQIP